MYSYDDVGIVTILLVKAKQCRSLIVFNGESCPIEKNSDIIPYAISGDDKITQARGKNIKLTILQIIDFK